jgi:transcriptional regulator with XRE-family HTH domain
MNNRSDIHDRLAASLKEARKAKGLSLDAVARLSGVSRSMVSQIERGESSPTVATLWNLTQALQVDFAGLIERRAEPRIEIVRILSPAEAVGEHEVYDLGFSETAKLVSEPHSPGCREHLTVLEGSLRVTSGAESQTLRAGDTARYFADRPHSIEAVDGAARAILIVQNS